MTEDRTASPEQQNYVWTEEQRQMDLNTFLSFPKDTRSLVLRLLAGNVPDDCLRALDDHPFGVLLAQWVLRQPAYRKIREEDGEEE